MDDDTTCKQCVALCRRRQLWKDVSENVLHCFIFSDKFTFLLSSASFCRCVWRTVMCVEIIIFMKILPCVVIGSQAFISTQTKVNTERGDPKLLWGLYKSSPGGSLVEFSLSNVNRLTSYTSNSEKYAGMYFYGFSLSYHRLFNSFQLDLHR